MDNVFTQFLAIFGIIAAVCVTVGLLGLALLVRSIQKLDIPRDADFFTTMRHVPIALVIMLDLLDLGLDIFATPIVWIFLDRMGLPSLRNKALIEALIPFTGPIPTFTIGWIAARWLNLGEADLHMAQQLAQGIHPQIIDMDEGGPTRYNAPRKEIR